MARERTFVMIKPDHVLYQEEIFERLNNHATLKTSTLITHVPLAVIQSHYEPHREKPFFYYMTAAFEGRSVAIAIYEGPDAIQRIMDVCGPTDPAQAPKNTIRGIYSNDSLEQATKEGRPVQNVIHRSDSPLEAQREINVWETFL